MYKGNRNSDKTFQNMVLGIIVTEKQGRST